MFRRLNHKGISLVESVAAVVIISFMMITVFTLIVSARNQMKASQEESYAVQVANRVRDNITNNVDYLSVNVWVSGGDQTVNSSTCLTENPPFSCDLITGVLTEFSYDKEISITFLAQTSEDLQFKTISFYVEINYYASRTVEIQGTIYEE